MPGEGQNGALVEQRTTHMAWRTLDQDVCALFTLALGGGYTAYEVLRFAPDDVNLMYHSPTAALTTPTEPALTLRAPEDFPSGSVFQNLRASAEGFAAVIAPLGEVLLFTGGTPRRFGTRGSAAPGSPQLLQLVGDHVLWAEWEMEVRLVHNSPAQETEVFYEVPGVRLIGLSTDGRDIAWIQCYGWDGGNCDRTELWTAPYVREAAALAPRRVGDIIGASGTVGFGRYVRRPTLESVEAIDLATGAVSRYELVGLGEIAVIISMLPVYVGPDETAFAVRTEVGGPLTLVRLSFDAFE
ncbi:MAG: hypothetical protein D6685_01590 [Bacteroidetes bacterium]|nr:MAG: hypothetical protein D6685_01590 [Bacteroidota bacterium]